VRRRDGGPRKVPAVFLIDGVDGPESVNSLPAEIQIAKIAATMATERLLHRRDLALAKLRSPRSPLLE